MVVPGDRAGGRYMSDLVSLQVGSLPEPSLTMPGGGPTNLISPERCPTQRRPAPSRWGPWPRR